MRTPTTIALIGALLLAGAVRAEAQANDEERATELLLSGIGLLDEGKIEDAEAIFREVVRIVPEKGAPHFFLGKALVLMQRCADALPELERYLATTGEGKLVDQANELTALCRRSAPGPEPEAANVVTAVPVTPAAAPAPQPPPRGAWRQAGLAIAGAGLVSLGLAVKFGLDARALDDELSNYSGAWTDEALAAIPGKIADGESAETRMVIFAGIGASALIAGTTLYLRSSSIRSEGPGIRVSGSLLPHEARLGLSGTF